MNLNKLVPRIGAAVVTVTVFLFAAFLIIDFTYGSYIVCMFLPIGYIMMAAGFHHESADDRKAVSVIGMVFSAIYAVLILLVYFAQTTSVHLGGLSEDALGIRLVLAFAQDARYTYALNLNNVCIRIGRENAAGA